MMKGNIFINNTLMTAVEIPGFFIGILAGRQRRKLVLIASTVIATTALGINCVIPGTVN